MTQLNWGAAIGGLFLAIGVGFAGVEIGTSLIEMKKAGRVVTVKGLSERDVEATLATWRIHFRGVGDDAPAALAEADRAQQAVRAFALDGGLSEEEIANEPYSLRIERIYVNDADGQREVARFNAVGAVRLRTENIDAVDGLAGRTDELLSAGVLLGDSDYANTSLPAYIFTDLNAIKPDLIREATENARASAQQFAADSGSTVGDIASANQGVIQILARDGEFDERVERFKTIRVVSTVRYYLDD